MASENQHRPSLRLKRGETSCSPRVPPDARPATACSMIRLGRASFSPLLPRSSVAPYSWAGRTRPRAGCFLRSGRRILGLFFSLVAHLRALLVSGFLWFSGRHSTLGFGAGSRSLLAKSCVFPDS